ncbi:MAG TPA: ABC transporter substrate-binding protein [Nostocaceae cyanobacterium]|nr:ABC transporter substrate-binding protein [Nostocaceae cyanobacterium]
MSTRKILHFVAWIIAIAIIFISCHSLPPLPEEPVTIKLSGWGGSPVEQKLLRQVLKNFAIKHPKIQVQYEVISEQYMDVITTRLIGEAAPDVFYLETLEAPFIMSQNVLEPLEKYITPEFDLPDIEPKLLNNFKYQNHIYGIPKDYSTLALFYNKKSFQKAGLTHPPQTWEELRSYSQKLTGKINRFGYGESAQLSRQAYKITAFGGKIVDQSNYAKFASQQSLKGLQLVIDQYRQDKTSALKFDVGTNSESEMFGQEKVAMVLDGNWSIPFLQETFSKVDFATAEVPKINGKRNTMVFNVAYVMNKHSKHKQAAWKLISYLTGKEGMAKWTGTGFALPTRKSVAKKLGYDKDNLRSALVAGIDYATPWQIGKYPSPIVNNFDNQFISTLLGQQALKPAMQRAERNANLQIKMMK